MYDQFNPKYNNVPRPINLLLLLSFIGIVLTGGQSALILFQGDTICLNEGCKIVESLTTVSPFIFNLAGCCFFLTLFAGFLIVRMGSSLMFGFTSLLLLAAMAAEGVLLSFQHYVAEVFCSYCLIIFSIIFLLNMLLGLRHLFKGIVMLMAVVIAFSALKFSNPRQQATVDIDQGVYAALERDNRDSGLHLFFSATCPHCEEVMETIDKDFTCSINFNPVGVVESIGVEGSQTRAAYLPEINRTILKAAGFNEIPVLAVRGEGEVKYLAGKNRILGYLDENCRPLAETASPVTDSEINWQQPGQSFSGESSVVQPYLVPESDDESCGIDVDCENENSPFSSEPVN